jgi:hypothetical protein
MAANNSPQHGAAVCTSAQLTCRNGGPCQPFQQMLPQGCAQSGRACGPRDGPAVMGVTKMDTMAATPTPSAICSHQ